ncbi:MAG TPA: sensor histidine kinase [Gemmatimonadaceae bacterium]|nr:sensor histidine kinase [Gemmatimonadaceae bacterium]
MREYSDTTYVVDAVSPEEIDAAANVWRRRFAAAGILIAVWAVPGMVAGFALHSKPLGDVPILVSLPRALVWQMSAWMTWALWTAFAVWLVRKLPFRRGTWQLSALVFLVLGVVITSIQILWAVVLDRWFYPGQVTSTVGYHIRDAVFRLSDFFVVAYMAIVAAAIGIDYFRRYREGLTAAERLRTQMVQAQLLALRSQLNPHFLFNALNSLITLMDRDVPAAQRMVARIGELLRLALTANETSVPLDRELNLVMQYLEIERIRFGDRLSVTIDVPDELRKEVVPNLVLQPLVENAIVHGVAPRPGPGTVSVEARRTRDELVLRVIDDGVGLKPQQSRSGYGIGVGNTRARLKAIYGDAASLTLRERDGGGCIAEVRLPAMAAPETERPGEANGHGVAPVSVRTLARVS